MLSCKFTRKKFNIIFLNCFFFNYVIQLKLEQKARKNIFMLNNYAAARVVESAPGVNDFMRVGGGCSLHGA